MPNALSQRTSRIAVGCLLVGFIGGWATHQFFSPKHDDDKEVAAILSTIQKSNRDILAQNAKCALQATSPADTQRKGPQ